MVKLGSLVCVVRSGEVGTVVAVLYHPCTLPVVSVRHEDGEIINYNYVQVSASNICQRVR